jgi:hypothetical protein
MIWSSKFCPEGKSQLRPVSFSESSQSGFGSGFLQQVRARARARQLGEVEFAAHVLRIIAPMRSESASLRKIADALKADRIPTLAWAATQVADILRRPG